MKKKLKKALYLFTSLFPTKLPTGTTQFDQFYKKIIDTYDLPDLPSYKNAVATMIMHLDPLTTSKSRVYFGRSIKKSMANQVAYEVIQQIRETEKNEQARLNNPQTCN